MSAMYRSRGLGLVSVALLAGCSFVHGSLPISQDDASPALPDAPDVDAPIVDAAVDAPPDAPPDASLTVGCPPAPTGCSMFGCAGSPDSCYYYCPNTASFSGARSACQNIGQNGCLVTLNDETEDACVRLHAGAGSLIYIGLVQSASGAEPAGGWGWSCGTSMYGPKWTGNEPNNSGFGGEDCGAMNTAGGWVDVGCSETFRYVCEVPRP